MPLLFRNCLCALPKTPGKGETGFQWLYFGPWLIPTVLTADHGHIQYPLCTVNIQAKLDIFITGIVHLLHGVLN